MERQLVHPNIAHCGPTICWVRHTVTIQETYFDHPRDMQQSSKQHGIDLIKGEKPSDLHSSHHSSNGLKSMLTFKSISHVSTRCPRASRKLLLKCLLSLYPGSVPKWCRSPTNKKCSRERSLGRRCSLEVWEQGWSVSNTSFFAPQCLFFFQSDPKKSKLENPAVMMLPVIDFV